MATITICSDFRAPQNNVWQFPLFPHLFAMKWWDRWWSQRKLEEQQSWDTLHAPDPGLQMQFIKDLVGNWQRSVQKDWAGGLGNYLSQKPKHRGYIIKVKRLCELDWCLGLWAQVKHSWIEWIANLQKSLEESTELDWHTHCQETRACWLP